MNCKCDAKCDNCPEIAKLRAWCLRSGLIIMGTVLISAFLILSYMGKLEDQIAYLRNMENPAYRATVNLALQMAQLNNSTGVP